MNDLVSYTTNDARVSVRLDGETVWLTQRHMAELFGCDRSVITKHLQNIFSDGELDEKATCANFALVQIEGGRSVSRPIAHYNLDAIISVGYRVNSKRGVQFRQWATAVIKERLLRDYVPKSEVARIAAAEKSLEPHERVRRIFGDNISRVLSANGVCDAESVFIQGSVAAEWLEGTNIPLRAVNRMGRNGKLEFVVPQKCRFPTDKKNPLRTEGVFCVDSWRVREDIAAKRRPYVTYIIGHDYVTGRVSLIRHETKPIALYGTPDRPSRAQRAFHAEFSRSRGASHVFI